MRRSDSGTSIIAARGPGNSVICAGETGRLQTIEGNLVTIAAIRLTACRHDPAFALPIRQKHNIVVPIDSCAAVSTVAFAVSTVGFAVSTVGQFQLLDCPEGLFEYDTSCSANV